MNDQVVAPPLAETLLRYSRYIAIVAEQLAAGAAGDRDRLMTLLEERKVIEEELGSSHDDEIDPAPSLDELLGLGLAEVTEQLESDRLDKDQWVQISNGAITSARTLSLRPAAAAGRYPEPGNRGERLDLRF